MKNPIFCFIQEYRDQINKIILKRFEVPLLLKSFKKKKVNYWLIELVVHKEMKAILRPHGMEILEHHVTIPEDVDKKKNSCYHYTVTLRNVKEKKDYKTHIYFDKRNHISLEPKLFLASEDESAPLEARNLSEEEITKISNLSMPCVEIVLLLQEKKRTFLQALELKKKTLEEKLSILSWNLNENKEKYRSLLEEQIKNISKMENMGDISYSGEKKIYDSLSKNILKSHFCFSEECKEEKEPSLESHSNLFEKEEPLISPILPEKKTKNALQVKERDEKNTRDLIQRCKSSIDSFDAADLEKQNVSDLIRDMMNYIAECNAFFLHEDGKEYEKDSTLVFEMRIKLLKKITKFFEKADFEIYADVYFIAVQSQLLPFQNRFFEWILRKDNVDFLNKTLSFKLLIDAEKYHFIPGMPSFTALEWCAYFNSRRCFKVLLENDFYLSYVDSPESPFFSMLANILKLYLFLPMNRSSSRFLSNMIFFLESRCKQETGENRALLEMDKELCELIKKDYEFLRKKENAYIAREALSIQGKFLEFLDKNENFFIEEEKRRRSLEYRRSFVRLLKSRRDFHEVLSPKFQALLKDSISVESLSNENNLILSLPEKIALQYQISCWKIIEEKTSLFTEIIQSGESNGIVGGVLSFRADNRKSHDFLQRLKKIKNKSPLEDPDLKETLEQEGFSEAQFISMKNGMLFGSGASVEEKFLSAVDEAFSDLSSLVEEGEPRSSIGTEALPSIFLNELRSNLGLKAPEESKSGKKTEENTNKRSKQRGALS